MGARDNVHRTIFAVGDEKQSIYSFQGADPDAFALGGTEFSARVRDARGRFEPVKLTLSFRSTDDVLSAVDRVFARDDARKGLTRDPDPIGHKAIRVGAPGYVEVWPSLGADCRRGAGRLDDTSRPCHGAGGARRRKYRTDHRRLDKVGRSDRGKRKAAGGWRRPGAGAQARPLRPCAVPQPEEPRDPGCRRRPAEPVSAYRGQGPGRARPLPAAARRRPVAGGRAAKARSSGESEETLFDLAWNRPRGTSLFASLRQKAETDAGLARIAAQLAAWASEAAFKPVFEFYAGVLGRDQARRRMIGRLGHEAGDILDEFLNFCLAEEQTGLPGLEAFLATLESAAPEIKREMDQGRGEVRIMTVHAAKGLEAPVVFLVDSGGAPFSDQHLPRLMPFESARHQWQGNGFLWRSASEVANGFSRGAGIRAKEKAEEEYRRLLYVGMTRAEDRLIVCGYHGKRAPAGTTWHAIVSGALTGSADSEERRNPWTGETVHRYRVTKATGAVPDEEARSAKETVADALPGDLFATRPEPPALPRPLSPSGASALIAESDEPVAFARSPVLDLDDEPGFSAQRGLAMHRLLQMLPALPESEWADASLRYLARAGSNWSEHDRRQAFEAVDAILHDQRFAPLFSPNSRAEVAVMGTLRVKGRERAVSGKIDRLAVAAGEVLIVDYKTNRPAPAGLDDVPPAYVLQLALYRALLQPLYPGLNVSAALLFTEVPRLIPLPPGTMDAALARLAEP